MLGHGQSVQAFRASEATGEIGSPSTPAFDIHPASTSEADELAAKRVRAYDMDLYFDPFLRGEYPSEIVDRFGAAWPTIQDGDMATISSPVDFVGVTYYVGVGIGDGPADRDAQGEMRWLLPPVLSRLLDAHVVSTPGPEPRGTWMYNPRGVFNVLSWLRERHGNPPVHITENGTTVAGVEDTERIEYIRDHLIAAHKAIDAGIDLRGWFVWAVMDTWEFGRGFQPYGLIQVDYETLARTPRNSASWYRDVIAVNGFDAP
jgi:beta-glucosidase